MLFIVFVSQAMAQGSTYKEVKTIEKKIDSNSKSKLSIKGERTFLTVNTWTKDYIQAKIEVVSKYTDRDQARADLEKINVVCEKQGRKVIYSNALRISSPADKPKSNLSVIVSLTIPSGMDVDITNAFGKLDMSGTYGEVTSKSDFTVIDIHGFGGQAELQSKYGDLKIDDYQGELTLQADRSNLIMTDVTGKMDIEAQYGEVDIYYPTTTSNYKVNVSVSPMNLYIPSNFQDKISMSCKDCNIKSRSSELSIKVTTDKSKQNADYSTQSSPDSNSLFVSELEDINVHSY